MEAFDAKLGPIIGRGERAEAFLVSVMNPANAISAIGPGGALLGVAGFHDESGGFIGGVFADMRKSFGLFSALWRWALLSLFERAAEEGELLLDGIVVAQSARREGLGGAILDFVAGHARANDRTSLRLEVVDANPRARALYRKKGFTKVASSRSLLMRPLFGFTSAETMRLTLAAPAERAGGD